MTAEAPDTRREEPTLRDLYVVAWRYECLEDAGYPVEAAIQLAERADVDLHVACRLLSRGASVNEALRILS